MLTSIFTFKSTIITYKSGFFFFFFILKYIPTGLRPTDRLSLHRIQKSQKQFGRQRELALFVAVAAFANVRFYHSEQQFCSYSMAVRSSLLLQWYACFSVYVLMAIACVRFVSILRIFHGHSSLLQDVKSVMLLLLVAAIVYNVVWASSCHGWGRQLQWWWRRHGRSGSSCRSLLLLPLLVAVNGGHLF